MARDHPSRAILGASLLTTLGTLPVFLLASQSVLVRGDLGFGERRFGLAVGTFFAAAAAAGLAVPTVSTTLGWRSTFVACGSAGVLVAVAGLARRTPAVVPSAGDGLEGRDRPPMRALLVAMLAIALASAAANSLGAFVASWGFEIGLSPSEAGVLMAVAARSTSLPACRPRRP